MTTFQEPKAPPAYGGGGSGSSAPAPYNPPSVAQPSTVAPKAGPAHVPVPGGSFRGVGVLPNFCQHRTPLALHIREGGRGAVTLDDFDITDAVTGHKVFRIDASIWGSAKKRMYDVSGKHILTVRPDIGWVKSWRIEDPELGRDLAWIDAKFGFGTRLKAKFADRAGGRGLTELRIEGQTGSWRDKIVDIMLQDGTRLARIERQKTGALNSWMRIDDYVLTVQPGVDAALMVGLCVCADELYDK